MELVEQFRADLMANSPDWVLIWLQVLIGVLALSVLFAPFRPEARAILVGTLMGIGMTIVIYAQFGFTRILGVGHILFWTPTLFYMLSLQGTASVEKTWFSRWLWLAIAVMAVSLALDYSDLVRYLLGERGPIEL
ncbi:MAG: hypothetical protein NXH72_12050 [Hyphomonadaceae bacterium]|nr:hypothetical protein [Hyphomonadaceae bacterium]